MRNELLYLLSGEVLDEEAELSPGELCPARQLPTERLLDLVEEGVIKPLRRDPTRWRSSRCHARANMTRISMPCVSQATPRG